MPGTPPAPHPAARPVAAAERAASYARLCARPPSGDRPPRCRTRRGGGDGRAARGTGWNRPGGARRDPSGTPPRPPPPRLGGGHGGGAPPGTGSKRGSPGPGTFAERGSCGDVTLCGARGLAARPGAELTGGTWLAFPPSPQRLGQGAGRPHPPAAPRRSYRPPATRQNPPPGAPGPGSGGSRGPSGGCPSSPRPGLEAVRAAKTASVEERQRRAGSRGAPERSLQLPVPLRPLRGFPSSPLNAPVQTPCTKIPKNRFGCLKHLFSFL